MAKLNPKTFFAPSGKELRNIKKDDWVKVSCMGERFWIKVDEKKGGNITGFVDNDLIYSRDHGIYCGDRLEVKSHHVYDIMKGREN